jgi:hypothetical protein
MSTFDAPSRETCTARRSPTNTPLQALALLNDVTYLEAARVLGEKMLAAGPTPRERVAFGFSRALSRSPRDDELALLTSACESLVRQFAANPQAAADIVLIGDQPASENVKPVELAACLSIANMLLNLDEFVVVE